MTQGQWFPEDDFSEREIIVLEAIFEARVGRADLDTGGVSEGNRAGFDPDEYSRLIERMVGFGYLEAEFLRDGSGRIVSVSIKAITRLGERRVGFERGRRTAPRDLGAALLDPLTTGEFAAIEGIIGELYRAAGINSLTEDQQNRIIELAELLKDVQAEVVPGATPRWRVVGPVWGVIVRLMKISKEMPVQVLGWVKLYEVLNEIGWSETAKFLPPH